MIEEVNKLLEEKGINHSLVKSTIISYVIKHTELFGNVISFESVMDRLRSNLDSVQLIYPNPDQRYGSAVGEYIGFNDNKIIMYFSEEHLKNETLRNDFIDILTHELTHCIYRIKLNDLFEQEKHVFATYQKLIDGTSVKSDGTEKFIEPIINFISTTINGKKNSCYIQGTNAIGKISNIIGVENIVLSAFNSDYEMFKSLFNNISNDAYDNFERGLSFVTWNDDLWTKRGNEIIDNVINGSDNDQKIV